MHILLLGASIVVATLQSLFSRLYSDRYPRATGMASALAYAVFYGAFIGLATLALATYYQTSPEKDAEYSGPRVQSATADGGTVTLAFTHTGSGLKSLNTNGTLTGFEIAGTDGTYYPAEATIDGETVVLTCTQVAQPATVRYAWTWFPEVSLGNAEGYPAFPFELAIAN